MKLLKKLLFPILAIGSFCLTSCGPGGNYYNEALGLLKSSLKDPDSMKISQADGYYNDHNGDIGWACKITYNAKNSYGAYVGYHDAYYALYSYGVSEDNGTMYAILKADSSSTHVNY